MHIVFLAVLGHYLWVHLGISAPGSPWYNFWSGFGSDLGEFAIAGGLITMVRSRNCEVHRCWRLGRHVTAAGHKVCRKHHPDDKLTAEQVVDAHNAAI